jgi:hypothetical protein
VSYTITKNIFHTYNAAHVNNWISVEVTRCLVCDCKRRIKGSEARA